MRNVRGACNSILVGLLKVILKTFDTHYIPHKPGFQANSIGLNYLLLQCVDIIQNLKLAIA